MKKILLTFLSVFVLGSYAWASEPTKMIFPFGPVAAANPYRAMIEQITQNHSKTPFVMEFAAGGGGLVGTTLALNATRPVVLAHSSAFFIAPKLPANRGLYDPNEWRMIKHVCDAPFGLVSKNYKNIRDVPKDRPVVVGLLGSTSQLAFSVLRDIHPNWEALQYKTSSQALTDVMGGHIDMAFVLPGEFMGHYDAGTVNVLGVTGPAPLKNIPTLVSQGYTAAETLNTAYYIFVNKKVDPALQESWKQLFNSLNQTEIDRASLQTFCVPSKLRPADLDKEFAARDRAWAALVNKITK